MCGARTVQRRVEADRPSRERGREFSLSSEKRLSLSFGDFACDIVGYDEPFSVLQDVVGLLDQARGGKSALFDGDGPPPRRFAAALAENARALDMTIKEIDGRFVVTALDAEDEAAPEAVAAPEPPAAAIPSPPPMAEIAPPVAMDDNAPDGDASPEEAPAAATVDLSPNEPAPVGDAIQQAVEGAFDSAPAEISLDDRETADDAPLVLTAAGPDQGDAAAPGVIGAPSSNPAQFAASGGRVIGGESSVRLEIAPPESAIEASAPTARQAPPPKPGDAATPEAEAQGEERRAMVSQRPRIVIDRSRSRPHPRTRVATSTTITRSSAAPQTGDAKVEEPVKAAPTGEKPAETAPQSPTPSVAKDAAADREADAPAAMPRAEPASEPQRPVRFGVGVGDENFLFSDVVGDQRADGDAKDADETEDEPAERPDAAPSWTAKAEEAAPRKAATEEIAPPKRSRGFGDLFRRRRREDEVETDEDAISSDEEARFARLRETAEASLPKLDDRRREPAKEKPQPPLFAVSDGGDLDSADGPGAFARRVGAQSLQDLLEASAAYMSIVEGKAKFSRRDVMQAFSEIGLETEFSPEARLKSFRKLVAAGAIIRADDGMFAISHATRFGYETQLRSN